MNSLIGAGSGVLVGAIIGGIPGLIVGGIIFFQLNRFIQRSRELQENRQDYSTVSIIETTKNTEE